MARGFNHDLGSQRKRGCVCDNGKKSGGAGQGTNHIRTNGRGKISGGKADGGFHREETV